MTLKSEIENGLKDAMRASDVVRKNTLRLVLSAVKLAEVEQGSALSDEAVLAVVQKELKSRREAIADAQRANRPDLVAASQAESVILEGYLPKGLSPDELEALVQEVIAEVGATSAKQMGQVMKALLPRVQGRAGGDQVSAVVRRLLP